MRSGVYTQEMETLKECEVESKHAQQVLEVHHNNIGGKKSPADTAEAISAGDSDICKVTLIRDSKSCTLVCLP